MKLRSTEPAAVGPAASATGGRPWWFFGPLPGLLLFATVVGVFFPSLGNGFIEFDDSIYVFNNDHVKNGFSLANLAWAFSTVTSGNWHPLTWCSHMLDCQIFGLAAWGHHLTSVLLHALNTALLFLVLRRMTGRQWASLAVAALFGLHPMRVESVTWICERKDLLCGTFWLLTLWAHVRFVEESRGTGHKAKWFYVASLTFFLCGLMSKPAMVTLPFVLLLLDFWPLRRWEKGSVTKLVTEKIPFFLLMALVCVVTFIAQKHTGMMKQLSDLPFGACVENALVSYARYLGKTIWPVDLCALYPHPVWWPSWVVIGATLLIIGVSAFVVAQRKQRPYLLTGWLWYLGALVPMIGLVQVGSQSMADRYSYLPIIGVIIALVWAVTELTRNWRLAAPLIGGTALLVCIALTHRQISYWKSNESIWRQALTVTGNNFEAHYRLGRALALQGDLGAATLEFNEVTVLRPNFAEGHYSLGKALALQGRLDEALAQFLRATELEPDNVVALNNLGNILLQKGQTDDAMIYFRRALEIQPDNAPAHSNLGYALFQKGRVDEAIDQLQRAVEIQPQNSSAHNNLGAIFLRKGEPARAIVHFQTVLKLEPASAEAHNNLANALLSIGQLDEAVREFSAALALSPGSAEIHRNLGYALSKRGRLDDAIKEFEEAIRLRPDYAEARTNLAITLDLKQKSAASPVQPKP